MLKLEWWNCNGHLQYHNKFRANNQHFLSLWHHCTSNTTASYVLHCFLPRSTTLPSSAPSTKQSVLKCILWRWSMHVFSQLYLCRGLTGMELVSPKELGWSPQSSHSSDHLLEPIGGNHTVARHFFMVHFFATEWVPFLSCRCLRPGPPTASPLPSPPGHLCRCLGLWSSSTCAETPTGLCQNKQENVCSIYWQWVGVWQ